MRVFVAIDLDPGLKKTVREFVEVVRKTGAAVRWVDSGGMHLTLKFLGEIDPRTVPSVEEEIRRASALSRRFPLVLEGTGCFPGGRRPRVLWIGIREEPALGDLHKRLDEGLARLGFVQEERPFHAHLTIGRVKGPGGLSGVLGELEKSRTALFGTMAVEKVTLFQSILRPAGAEYRVVTEFDLP